MFYAPAHAAEPNHTISGLVGNTLPKYLWKVRFKNHFVRCSIGGIETTVKVRMYWKEAKGDMKPFAVRGDLIIGEVFIGHYIPVIRTLVTIDKDHVITKAEQIDVFSEQKVCEFAAEVVR